METPKSYTDNSYFASDSKDKKPKVEWSPENEKILVEWCDIAQCYKWLNSRAHHKYARLHAWFTIPAIILSTISGTASFAQESIPASFRSYASMSVGSINIAVGILATIQQYLKISELNESHRVSSISWDKYARNIRIELAKAPTERPDASIFIKHNRDEFDRLMETSPSIPQNVIAEFMSTFAHSKDPIKSKQFAILKKPDICDIIVSAEENRHHWYKDVELNNINYTNEQSELEIRVEQDILKRQSELRRREQDIHVIELKLKEKENEQLLLTKLKIEDEEQKMKNHIDTLNNFVKIFEMTHGRIPIDEEIVDKFKDNIDKNIIDLYIQNNYDSLV